MLFAAPPAIDASAAESELPSPATIALYAPYSPSIAFFWPPPMNDDSAPPCETRLSYPATMLESPWQAAFEYPAPTNDWYPPAYPATDPPTNDPVAFELHDASASVRRWPPGRPPWLRRGSRAG